MKIFLTVIALFVVGGSFWADYKWRKWIAVRKSERDESSDRRVN